MILKFSARGRVFLAAAVLAVGGATVAYADAAATVEHRQAEMKKMGGAMKALGQTAKGEKPFGPETAAAAETVQTVAKEIPDVFKENATSDKSRAKPEIWTQWDKFVADGKALEDTTPALIAAAKGNDPAALGAALGATGKACGTCHDSYRNTDL
jgi:cytochrome c556